MAQQRLADWLVEQCRARGLNWSEASKNAGISPNAISEIVGGVPVGIKRLRALAHYFNVPLELLVGLTNNTSLSQDERGEGIHPQADASLEEIREIVLRLPPDLQDEFAREVLNMARGMDRIRRTAQEQEA